jgi:hypothetical protein
LWTHKLAMESSARNMLRCMLPPAWTPATADLGYPGSQSPICTRQNRSQTGIEPEYAWSQVRIQAGAQVAARASLQLRRQLDRAQMAAPGKSTRLALGDRQLSECRSRLSFFGCHWGAIARLRCSNCVESQELNTGCQGVWVRMIAFRIVRSFRIQATIATFFCLPALSKC